MRDDLVRRVVVNVAIELCDWYHQNQHGEMVLGASDEEEAWYKAEDIYTVIERVPTAESELEREIKRIGYTGKEGIIFIGGRKFAVREVPQ